MTIIYHSKDFDGFASAAIVLSKYPHAKLIGWDYPNGAFPKVENEDAIYIVDLSPKFEELKYLCENNEQVFLFDHHKTTYEIVVGDPRFYTTTETTFKNLIYDIRIGEAGTEITFKHLYPNISLPPFLELIANYDVFRDYGKTRWEEEVMPFQLALALYVTDPKSMLNYWQDYGNREIQNLIAEGKILVKYRKSLDAQIAKLNAFEYPLSIVTKRNDEIEGSVVSIYQAIVINTGLFDSQSFDAVYNEDLHDILIGYCFRKNIWKYSVYTRKKDIDCSKICKSFGGGGHREAAGFELDYNLFDINSEKGS